MESGLDKVETRTIELTSDANSILNSVQDLVAVSKIDESEVVENVKRGKGKAKGVVEELNHLDNYETSLLEKTKQDLQTMRNYISDIESKFKSGDLSVLNYNVDALRDIAAYNSIVDRVFGEEQIDSAALEVLFEKMLNDESLASVEKEMLYDYFQHVYLDKKMKKEINEVADSISEDGIDELKDRLNDKVVVSIEKLESEMAIIHAYLYLGNKSPGEINIDNGTRAKLNAYLMLLKNYHSTMEDDTVIIVDKLNYEKNHEDIAGHYIFSALQTAEYNVDKDVDKEMFREWIFDPYNPTLNNYSLSEIRYYVGTDATSDHRGQELDKLKDKQANYTSDFFTKELITKIISETAGILKVEEAVNIAKSALKYQSEKNKQDGKITVEKALKTASRFDMEFAISKNQSIPDQMIRWT